MSALCWLTPGGSDPDGITPPSGAEQDAVDLISTLTGGIPQTYKHYLKLTILSKARLCLLAVFFKNHSIISPVCCVHNA